MQPRKGVLQKKILVLLWAGLALGLTRSSKKHLSIVRGAIKEFKNIETGRVNRAVNSLYASKLVRVEKHSDGTTTLMLSDHGKVLALRYNLEIIQLKKTGAWNGKWHVVLYDIPEEMRALRVDVCRTLKRLGFYELQHSVWVYPFECTREIEFLIEAFGARAYIRRMVVDEIDIPGPLYTYFKLRRA